MTAAFPDRPTLPPVQCEPWCADGDGHPDARSAEDQRCFSRVREALVSGVNEEPREGAVFRVYATHGPWRESRPVVQLDFEGGIPYDMTPAQGRALAEALSEVAADIERAETER